MLNVSALRILNLETLRLPKEKGKEFAERLGMKPQYLSLLLGGKERKKMGDKLARAIEQRLNLPDGWMDTHHTLQAVDNALAIAGIDLNHALHIAQFMKTLSPEAVKNLEMLVRSLQPHLVAEEPGPEDSEGGKNS